MTVVEVEVHNAMKKTVFVERKENQDRGSQAQVGNVEYKWSKAQSRVPVDLKNEIQQIKITRRTTKQDKRQ